MCQRALQAKFRSIVHRPVPPWALRRHPRSFEKNCQKKAKIFSLKQFHAKKLSKWLEKIKIKRMSARIECETTSVRWF